MKFLISLYFFIGFGVLNLAAKEYNIFIGSEFGISRSFFETKPDNFLPNNINSSEINSIGGIFGTKLFYSSASYIFESNISYIFEKSAYDYFYKLPGNGKRNYDIDFHESGDFTETGIRIEFQFGYEILQNLFLCSGLGFNVELSKKRQGKIKILSPEDVNFPGGSNQQFYSESDKASYAATWYFPISLKYFFFGYKNIFLIASSGISLYIGNSNYDNYGLYKLLKINAGLSVIFRLK